MIRRRFLTLAGSLLLLPLAGCDDYPRDPESTTNKVLERGEIRVGVVDHPPWVDLSGPTPRGVETRLVTSLAEEMGVEVRWARAPAEELMHSLAQFDLDLLIGGLTKDSVYAKHVALTTPYHTTRLVIATESGETPASIEGLRVNLPYGSPAAKWLREKGAEPVFVDSLHSASGAIVVPAAEAVRYGRTATDIVLHRHEHVLAAPPGENGWLMRLDRHLSGDEWPVERWVLEEAPR